MPITRPLDFPLVVAGANSRTYDFRFFLYRGGASLDVRALKVKTFDDAKRGRHLRDFKKSRFKLVEALFNTLTAQITAGCRPATAFSRIRALMNFYAWCDLNDLDPTLTNAQSLFLKWCANLETRSRKENEITEETAYRLAGLVDLVLRPTLGLNFRITRISKVWSRGSKLTPESDKADLQAMKAFGHVLVSICDALTPEVTFGPLPITIKVNERSELIEWSGLPPIEKVKAQQMSADDYRKKDSDKRRLAWENDRSPATHHEILNLRILCELLIFIAQTGMNLAQAQAVNRSALRMKTVGPDVEFIRAYKHRRGGVVVFRAFRSYKPHYSKYVRWLSKWLPENEERLFPILHIHGGSHDLPGANFNSIIRRFRKLDLPFFGPQILRRARVNWFLERLGNPAQGSEIAQHSLSTLNFYQRPSHQLAMGEISSYHRRVEQAARPPGPGECVNPFGPIAIDAAPLGSPQPDCANPSGCLFCGSHRDIDSQDYVWSLVSYRKLKVAELLQHRAESGKSTSFDQGHSPHPAKIVVDRVVAKLEEFRARGDTQEEWIEESETRLREGRYHPMWAAFITLMEQQ